jgi:hypothetical protein
MSKPSIVESMGVKRLQKQKLGSRVSPACRKNLRSSESAPRRAVARMACTGFERDTHELGRHVPRTELGTRSERNESAGTDRLPITNQWDPIDQGRTDERRSRRDCEVGGPGAALPTRYCSDPYRRGNCPRGIRRDGLEEIGPTWSRGMRS